MNENKTIWVVEGSTGEYSDHSEWPVKAFTKEEYAKEFVELCSAEYRRIILRLDELELYYFDSDLPEDCKHKYDEGFTTDYTGTLYRCYPVEVEK
jgi:hypothetical protein